MAPSRRFHDLLHHLTAALADVQTRFARLRCWSPSSVILAVFWLTRPDQRSSYATMLSDLAHAALKGLGLSSVPTPSSLSMARGKVPLATFREVLCRLVDQVSGVIPGILRHHHPDRRFVAVDATSLVCPRSPSTLAGLDRPKLHPWLEAHYPRALVVMAFDVLRKLPLEWVLLPKGRGERAAAQPLLARLRRGDVVIMDRGYPARWLVELFSDQGIDVVLRMTASKLGSWAEVTRFLASGAASAVIDLPLGKRKTIPVRLLRRNPPRGRPLKHQRRETMVILTTLLPKDGFEAKDVFDLYGRRWGIESLFREVKEAFDIERFHARSLDGIQQEIATVLMWVALTSVVQAAVQERIDPQRRANRAACRAVARGCLIRAIEGRPTELERLIGEAARHSYTPRSGRSFPRRSELPFGRSKNRAAK